MMSHQYDDFFARLPGLFKGQNVTEATVHDVLLSECQKSKLSPERCSRFQAEIAREASIRANNTRARTTSPVVATPNMSVLIAPSSENVEGVTDPDILKECHSRKLLPETCRRFQYEQDRADDPAYYAALERSMGRPLSHSELVKVRDEHQAQQTQDAICEKAAGNHQFVLGMKSNLARLCFQPYHVNTTRGAWGVHEQWEMSPEGGTYFYFENGRLTACQSQGTFCDRIRQPSEFHTTGR